jgi:hypothetical protein
MAQIREYNNQQVIQQDPLQTAARRQEVLGIEAGGEIQSGANALAEGVKRTEEHIAQTETSKVAADMATAHANLSKQWNDTVASADPNDHELAQRFIDQNVRPTFDKIGQGLITQQGQDYFQRASASAHAELFTKTSADQARLAGEAAVTNLDTLRNQQSNMVRQDPTTLQHALDAASDESLTRLFPTLPPEARQTLGRSMRADFAKSAAEGAIDQDAPSAKTALERGDLNDHLDGTTVQTLIRSADEKIRANAAAGRAADVEQRRVEKDNAEKFSTQVTTSLVDENGKERVPPDYFTNVLKYGQLPGAEPGRAEALISAGERILNNADTKDAPGLVSSFMNRLTSGNPPTRNEVLSHVGNDLKQSSANFIMEQMKETPQSRVETQLISQTLAEAKSTLGVNRRDIFGNLNPAAERDYSAFESWFLPELQKRVRAGKDPAQLLSPESPDYMLKDQVPFQRFKNRPGDEVKMELDRTAPPPPAASNAKRPSLDDIFGK